MRRRLTDTEKATADNLGLTHTEMKVALDLQVDPEVYAGHKAAISVGREEWEATLASPDGRLTDPEDSDAQALPQV